MLLCPSEALFLCSSVDLGAQLSSSNLAVTCQLESVEQNHVNSRINKHEWISDEGPFPNLMQRGGFFFFVFEPPLSSD